MRPTDMYEIPERVAARRHGLPVYGWRRHEVGLPRRGVTFPTRALFSCGEAEPSKTSSGACAKRAQYNKSEEFVFTESVHCLNLSIFTYSYLFNRIEIGSK